MKLPKMEEKKKRNCGNQVAEIGEKRREKNWFVAIKLPKIGEKKKGIVATKLPEIGGEKYFTKFYAST